ncbi:MAG: protein YgfX [Pseudomonadota bacterium]|nr:protein YgfX [Pseudomonadota bacterium]
MWVDLAQLSHSQWRIVCLSLCLVGLLLLLALSGGSAAVRGLVILILLVSAVVWWSWQARQPRCLALRQLNRVDWIWQQTQPFAKAQHTSVAWQQGRLQRVASCGNWVVVLWFEDLTLQREQVWVLWRDQVDDNNWRRLQVLVRYWSAPQDVGTD